MGAVAVGGGCCSDKESLSQPLQFLVFPFKFKRMYKLASFKWDQFYTWDMRICLELCYLHTPIVGHKFPISNNLFIGNSRGKY
jgi:hypothetical protein